MLDDVKMAFLTLGTGYETWCTLAGKAINSSCKISTILSNAANTACYDHTAFIQKYFNKHWTGQVMQLTAQPILPIL